MSAAIHQFVVPSYLLSSYGSRTFSVAGPMTELTTETSARSYSHYICFWTITYDIIFFFSEY